MLDPIAIARSGTFILDTALTEIFVKQFQVSDVRHNSSQINLIETLLHNGHCVLNYVFVSLSLKTRIRLETIYFSLIL